ncbi:MAG: FAD-binding oxidoreductase [Deltaproteobacteria bacterium]|nr:FAD-binding oxidoreductase [Deltaproteobacteria bacterium]
MSITRRRFLARTSTAALAATTLWPALRSRAFAAPAGGETRDGDLAELRKRFGARLVAPSDKDYDKLRRVRNRAFDDVMPRAIAMAASEDDVAAAVAWAAANKVPIVPRNGGHSYIGQSTCDGLVVSLVNMAGARVDKAALTAEIDAGALLGDVNVALLKQDVALPTGSCPSVGVAGLTLGGGIGFSSRHWGLMADNLVGARVVLASGEVVDCSETEKKDLLWLCRGGGGGQFGVVTKLRFRVHPVEPISEFRLSWPWRSAERALDAWQRFAPDAPDRLFSVCTLSKGKGTPNIAAYGRYFGSPKELREVLAPLVAAAKPTSAPKITASTLWASHVVGPGCWPDPAQCHSWNHPQPGRFQQQSYKVKSDFYRENLPSDGVATLIREMAGIQEQAISWGAIILDSLGGAINRVAKDATAYVHRDHRFQAEYVIHWGAKTAPAKVEANLAWLRGLYAAMRPWASGECYQNYPDTDRSDWRQAYYGQNLAHLEACKKALDPDRVFHGPQVL